MSEQLSPLDAAASVSAFFGSDPDAPIARQQAIESQHKFVRSQVQLAAFSKGATGRRMTAVEVYDAYGPDLLREVTIEGSASLIQGIGEPAATLRARRELLNLSEADLADHLKLDVGVVRKAETAGKQSPIRDLERIAQALALDEYQIGRPGAGGDAALAEGLCAQLEATVGQPVRPSDILALTESAWVISRQIWLFRRIAAVSNQQAPALAFKLPTNATDYRRGSILAQQLRVQFPELGRGPVTNLQTFVEDWLAIPVISVQLDERIAGAVLCNGDAAGIVINERGDNRRIWTRRVTLARALGHVLLCERRPTAGLIIESYADIEADYAALGDAGCAARQAGAFAMTFLAPVHGVADIVDRTSDPARIIAMVMMVYGVTAHAAVGHVKAVTGRDVPNFPVSDVPWSETVSRGGAALKPRGTPLPRTGQFALVVLKSFGMGLLSRDSVLAYLQCSDAALRDYQRMAEAMVY